MTRQCHRRGGGPVVLLHITYVYLIAACPPGVRGRPAVVLRGCICALYYNRTVCVPQTPNMCPFWDLAGLVLGPGSTVVLG